jgi:predicted RNase H-like HicB family nuclease
VIGYHHAMTLKVIIHEAEEGGFWAEVPALPGCFTQGETMPELEANLREAKELYLEVFPKKSKSPAVLTCFELSHAQAAAC